MLLPNLVSSDETSHDGVPDLNILTDPTVPKNNAFPIKKCYVLLQPLPDKTVNEPKDNTTQKTKENDKEHVPKDQDSGFSENDNTPPNLVASVDPDSDTTPLSVLHDKNRSRPHRCKKRVEYTESSPPSRSDSDFGQSTKKHHKQRVPALGPSRLCIQAQHDIITKPGSLVENDTKKESINRPAKSKPDNSDITPMTSNNTPKGDTVNDTTPSTSDCLVGKLSVTKHELKKYKRLWKFPCKLCETVAESRKEINDYHKANHEKCYCKTCGTACNTPSMLECHQCSHCENLPFECKDCDAKFAFVGQLKQHRFKHHKVAVFACMKCLK